MPRNGSGVYSAPPNTLATTLTTIKSPEYNAFVNDLVSDANAARPIVAGGTGATSLAGAQIALNVDNKTVYASKSSNYTATPSDNAAIFRFSAAATLGFNAAATLAANWHCDVFADGGAVTIDPSGSETINGQTTLVIPNGMMASVVCDGTQFFTVIRPSGFERIGGVVDLAGASQIIWQNLSAYRYLEVYLVGTLTAATTIFLRTSTNNGSSFDQGASNYGYSSIAQEGTTIGGTALTNQTYLPFSITTVATNLINLSFSLSDFNKASGTYMKSDMTYFNNSGGNPRRDMNYGYRNDSTARNALQITFTSATTFATGSAILMGQRG